MPLALLLLASPAAAADVATEPLPTLQARTAGLERRPGLLPLHLDRQRGRVWLEVPAPDARGEAGSFLYVEGLLTGLGSNPVGLDRGQLGDARVVTLRRVGGRVLLEEPNLRFRADSRDPAERRAVRESFATSVLWGGEIAALDADGRALVDFTSFVVRDAHGVAATLEERGQGTFALDEARSAIDLASTLSFPDNLEFEAVLTFTAAKPGELVRQTAPTAQAVTLVQHQSLVRLPDDGYRPRRFDPRSGSFSVDYLDYAAPLDAPLDSRWLVRHRLQKVDPAAPRSPARQPIVYYLDPGTPEPVRGALLDGARWWARAFEEAGFQDAFRVELLPAGAHPLDVRYNVIQWVHRATRGWSYGGGVVDPRTGEMVKGHVTLGSQRVRHDRLLIEGLVGTDRTGAGGPDDPLAVALARLRQLAAHEVGHTLGLAHNFAASAYGRESVMDYPAPLVTVRDDGSLDLERAYASGVGAWDVQAIRYAYAELPPGSDETAALRAILRESRERGLLFLSDQDARSPATAHPLASLWDNGDDAAAALEQALRVRALALERFGERNVRPGAPLALLHEVLAPLYLHHRYQLVAAAKLVGGVEYAYGVRGEDAAPARAVGGERQRRALRAVLRGLDPEVLDLPEAVVTLVLPRPFGYERHREMLPGDADPVFDPLAAAGAAARLAVEPLLARQRAARLVDLHRRDPGLPGLEEVLDGLVGAVFPTPAGEAPRRAELRRVAQQAVVDGLIGLAAEAAAPDRVRARVEARLRRLRRELGAATAADGAESAQRAYLAAAIGRHLDRERPEREPPPGPPPAPPGEPIGAGWELADCGFAAPGTR